jgi:hypothetical protein
MKNIILFTMILLSACSTTSPKQSASPAQAASSTQKQASPGGDTAPTGGSLSDLDAMTFACPKAALNAAAREAKKVPSQGSYQFSFFRIASGSHDEQYEIHFKSNVHDEPELKYCVSIYCQQGWDPQDPRTSKTTVQLMGDGGQPNADSKVSAHEPNCGHEPPSGRQQKRK